MPAPSEKDGGGTGARRRKLFGRRKGPKLSALQATLVRTLLPRLNVQLRSNADPGTYFDDPVDDVWLEIGFGAGEHFLWQAGYRENVGIIGAEPYESGVAKLLSKLYATSPSSFSSPAPLCCAGRENSSRGDLLARIRLYTGDAREIIEALPDASLGRVFLLFPDPWPKKRHRKRRFVQIETLDMLARVMKDGAEFRFASDDPDYVAWTLERVCTHPEFAWTAQRSSDWTVRPADWPETRYEQKALHGMPSFLRFERKKRVQAGLAKGCFPA